ncbi:MAG: hypothetical protein IPO58_23210 [Betaproteobacteria bacterium]|nr:hypothetical protein [Betaproteobacteria bacterium]
MAYVIRADLNSMSEAIIPAGIVVDCLIRINNAIDAAYARSTSATILSRAAG